MTIVSNNRKNIFGNIIDGEIELYPLGTIVEKTWRGIPQYFPYIEVDSYVVMPNHFHGIIIINEVGARLVFDSSTLRASPLHSNRLKPQSQRINGVKSQSFGAIIGSFKPEVTKRVHALGLIDQKMTYGEILRTNNLG